MNKFNPIIKFTERPNHAKELVNDYLKKGFKEFVAVGGDGTINEIGSQLINKDAVLNIISKGSGNGLARHLGIFDSDEECIARINTGKTVKIDVGLINNIPFLCAAGLGFDAYGALKFSESKGRGLRNYIKVGLTSFFKYQSLDVQFKNASYKTFSLTFGNASQFGNDAFITPDADISDGLMDCCIVKKHSKWASIKVLIQLFTKKIRKSRYVEYYKETHFELVTNKPALIHFDGESKLLNTGNVKIEVMPNALNIRI
jgi:diacylglycerol kinase (ATP)